MDMEVKDDCVMGSLSHHAYATNVHAPGYALYLWLFGCNKQCEGCMSDNLRIIKPFTDIRGMLDMIFAEAIAKGIDGIVISGGEPMLQPAVLEYFLEKANDFNLTSERKLFIHVYTGYKYEDLIKERHLKTIISRLDVLVDGEYREEFDDGKSLRGSSNQQIYFPTNRRDVIDAYALLAKTPRNVTTVFSEDLKKFINIGLS